MHTISSFLDVFAAVTTACIQTTAKWSTAVAAGWLLVIVNLSLDPGTLQEYTYNILLLGKMETM